MSGAEKFVPIRDEPDLKCLECRHFGANIYLFENHTAYPNCGDQSCVSAFFWDHQMALAAMEAEIYKDYKETDEGLVYSPEKGVEL